MTIQPDFGTGLRDDEAGLNGAPGLRDNEAGLGGGTGLRDNEAGLDGAPGLRDGEASFAFAAGTGHGVTRRTALKVVAAAPFMAGALVWTEPEIMEAQRKVADALAGGDAFEPQFFTASEWQTVRVLADLIIPRDERSGSASDVAVPEFLDFMMIDMPTAQERMRNGLAWLDAEMQKRFGNSFTKSTASEQAALLDELAWPKRAPESLKEGVAFFVLFRNLVLTGFWSSKTGIEDLQYMGNKFVAQWDGCPPAALEKLGVSYSE